MARGRDNFPYPLPNARPLLRFTGIPKRSNRSTRRRKRQLFDGDDSILGISDDFNGDFLQDLDVSGLVPPYSAFKNFENGCPAEVGPCDPNYPYRSYTGYCNNLQKPNYGKSLTTFARLLPPAYENGKSPSG